MKRIILALSFLCLSGAAQGTVYTAGVLDTIANLGTGFNDPTGYLINSSFLTTNQIVASASAIQPDGKIVVVGTRLGSPQRAVITRYNIDGSLDTAEFNNPYGGYQTQISATLSDNYQVRLSDVIVQPDGKIVVVGSATNNTNYPTVGAPIVQSLLVARLTPTSAPDTTFNSNGYVLLNLGQYVQANAIGNPVTTSSDIATAVALDRLGNIIVSGQTAISEVISRGSNPTDNAIFVLQFNNLGVLQTTFNSSSVVGGTNSDSFVTGPGLALLTMGSGTPVYSNGMGIDKDNNIVVVGSQGSANSQMFVARFLNGMTNPGQLDIANFNNDDTPGYLAFSTPASTTDIAEAVAFQSSNHNNRIIVVGTNGTQAVFAGITSDGILDTTNFGSPLGESGTYGYVVNGWTGSSPIAMGVVVQSDDSIVMSGMSNSTGATADFVLDAYSADGSSQLYFTNTTISNPSFGRGLSIQQNGSFVVPGTVGTGNTTFAVARYLGIPVEGAMDLYYNPGVSHAGWSVYPTTNTPTQKPNVTAMFPLSGTSSGDVYVATIDSGIPGSQLVQLNAQGVAGTPIPLVSIFANDVIADAENKAVVVGGISGPGGFISRYTNNAGTLAGDSSFGSGGATYETNVTSLLRVAQQSNGRYVAIGQAAASANGIVIAYNEDGTLASGSFGNNSYQGFNTITSAVFCDMLIDADNNIYIAYQNTQGFGVGANNICLVKFLADGTGFATDFGTNGGVIDTGLPNDLYSAPCITFDNYVSIALASVCLDDDTIVVQGYDIENGNSYDVTYLDKSVSLLSSPIITKVQFDTNEHFVFTGYDSNNMFVGRMIPTELDTLILDTTFAPYSTCPGIAKVNYDDNNPTNTTSLTAPYRVSNTVCINGNGAILFGGCENITSSTTVSLVGQMIGYINEEAMPTQVNRFPGKSGSDGKLTDGTPFNLNLSATLRGQPQALYTFGSGTFDGYTLVVTTDGTTAKLSMVDASTYALNTSSGATSFGDGSGQVTLSNLVDATSILVAVDGSIYVLGMDNSETPLVVLNKISSNGLSQSVIYPIINYTDGTIPNYAFTQAYCMVQQASGRILIGGYNSSMTSGLIFGLNPYLDGGSMDTSFAPSGGFIPGCYLLPPNSNPVMALAVGETSNQFGDADQIYFATTENTYSETGIIAIVSRLLENGTQLDPYFGLTGGQWIANVSSVDEVCMQINAVVEGEVECPYIVLSANTSTGIQVARFNRADGTYDTNPGVNPFVIIPTSENLVLQEMLCLSDETTLILASDTNSLSVARLTSSFVADSTFNPGGAATGVLNTTVPASSPSQVQFWAMDVLGNGGQGIIVAGDDNTTATEANPYLTQIVSSAAVTRYSQTASATPGAGIVDGTFNPINTMCGNSPGCLNLNSGINYSADKEDINENYPLDVVPTVLLQNPNGSYYIAGSDSSGTGIALMSDDDVQQPFGQGGNGILYVPECYNVSSMMISQAGLLIIAGTGTTVGEVYSPTTSWMFAVDPTIGEPFFYSLDNLEVNCAMTQQSNGRILIAGSYNGVGTILAFNSIDSRGLQLMNPIDTLDTTFANNGVYTLTGYGTINSILVDTQDNIYVIANDASNNCYITSINQPGKVINWTSPLIAAHSTNVLNNHLAFNELGGITAVAVDTTSNVIYLQNVLTTGTISTTLTLGVGVTGIVNPNVTSLCVDLNTSPGKVVLAGFDSATSPATPFVLRTTADQSTGLDTTFTSGCGIAGVVTTKHFSNAKMIAWYASMINADGKITVAGYGCHNEANAPYLARFYGDEFIGQYTYTVAAGTPGTFDLNFPADNPTAPTAGCLTLATTSTGKPVCVVPLENGYQYVGFSDGTIVRYTNDNVLDTCFGDVGYAVQAPNGLRSMILDGKGCLVVVGTVPADGECPPHGWISRYVAGNGGTLDCHFNGGDVKYIEHCQAANAVIEQSMARLIVTGQLLIPGPRCGGNIDGALFGLTHDGCPDATFSIYSESGVGVLDSGIELPGYAIVADQFDRILVAYPNSPCEPFVNLTRFTPSGELDYCFGCEEGTIRHILPCVEDPSQICITVDASNNVVVAANTVCGIKVVAYENTTGVNLAGAAVNISESLTSPSLTGLVASADGTVLVCGNQLGLQMWIARLSGYTLDASFNPNGLTPGIMLFNILQDQCDLAPIAIYFDGEISMVGYDEVSTAAFMMRAYNSPYTWQLPICLDSLPVGTNDPTFGEINNVGNGITFWASCDGTNQSAQAVALLDDDNIVVALDGSQSESGSKIYVNMFDVDGLPACWFGCHGRATVLCEYDNQYVNDMVTFTTINGCNKAILVGYGQNTTPSLTTSLLMQYNLDNAELDCSFAGANGNVPGLAAGDGLALNTVGLQSNGRIIAGGLDYSGNGLLLGYTAAGNLDQSFGQGGASIQGTTGIFASAIDCQDRLVIAYNDGTNHIALARILSDGSALDDSFGQYVSGSSGPQTGVITTNDESRIGILVGNSNIRLAINSCGHIVLAGVTNSGTVIGVHIWDASGSEILYSADITNVSPYNLSLTDFTMTKLLLDQNDYIIFVGYDSDGSTVVIRTKGDLCFDGTFNANGTPGYIKYLITTDQQTQTAGAFIHPDGRIIIAGNEGEVAP